MKNHLHHAGCGCLSPLSRRGILGLGIAASVSKAFPALAEGGHYEAMMFNCIDPRFTILSWAYMAGRGLKDLYSQFTIAGGPIGVVAPVFADWQKTWWDNLAITVQLHSIRSVIGLTHRDCGAAVVAFGERIKTDWAFETQKHTEALHEFRSQIGAKQPHLKVELGIMDLKGNVEVVT
jgi:hypothetical protein